MTQHILRCQYFDQNRKFLVFPTHEYNQIAFEACHLFVYGIQKIKFCLVYFYIQAVNFVIEIPKFFLSHHVLLKKLHDIVDG